MSTKTLKKRIALVAVSALSVGLLTVVSSPVANANPDNGPLTVNDIRIISQTAGTNLAAGVCAVDSVASSQVLGAAAIGSTATTISVGAKLEFRTGTNGLGTLVISGPAEWAGQPVSTSGLTDIAAGPVGTVATISADKKSVTVADDAASMILVATGAGAVTVSVYNAATAATGTLVKSFGITVVASCAGADAVSVSNSILAVNNADAQATSTSTDRTMDYADVEYGSTVYINVLLRDGFKANLATDVVLQASGTNGAIVGVDQAGISSNGVAATKASSSQTVSIFVSQDTTTNPGKALTTTVTVSANGTVIGTKTITILGLAASIEVPQADVKYGLGSGSQSTTTNQFKFIVKDNAGNRLELAPAATGAIAGTKYDPASGVTAVTTAGLRATSYRSPLDNSGAGDGAGTFTCSSTVSGSQSVTVGFYNPALVLVKSNAFTVNCSVGGINTFSVSTDKATYSPGEIATLTIKGSDALGKPVSDTTTMGAGYVNLSMPGMTLIGAAASSADTFTAGVKTYKFRVDQAEGSFVGQAQPTATTDDAAKTVAYTIKSSTATVSNADVLKSIVSLIASINKQIRALQKLILKR
jgi:trimeric autotransporter adhesin